MIGANGKLASQSGNFRLADLNVALLRERFIRVGHVRICPFMPDSIAESLAKAVEQRSDWRMIVNAGEKIFEIDGDAAEAMGKDRLAALDTAVHEAARAGFQFRYSSIRVPDDFEARRRSPDRLCAFADFLSSLTVIELIRSITGNSAISFADSQATRYGPGDFLTGHDDHVPGKHRHAAYVLGLTRNWRIEWGGLLLFHHEDGRVEGFAPDFNALDIFAVPQRHSVSYVTPFAGGKRHSVTGWFRSNQ
ncbi:2OG-Fe(II) oxygenase [Sphingobium cupriresistens]|uniref:2OG-Fe(II) oxygenase n=1 Tax=Sphingobium cupriresistens TaxID=1132417 RepID=UPI0009EC19DD|nr:2OG-Fe(II) oxygenase family protein [Sphingobium cupriresistens]